MDDVGAISDVVSKSNVVISLLGPNIIRTLPPNFFADQYRRVWAAMRDHNVKRIFAMGTFSIVEPQDGFSILKWLAVWFVYLLANSAWQNIINLGKAYEEEAQDLDWTIYRVGGVLGGHDDKTWARQRKGGVYEGWLGEKGWTFSTQRSELARWLVDAAEGKTAKNG
jgi:nucleoside-diphosphate-sugar epimerase